MFWRGKLKLSLWSRLFLVRRSPHWSIICVYVSLLKTSVRNASLYFSFEGDAYSVFGFRPLQVMKAYVVFFFFLGGESEWMKPWSMSPQSYPATPE